MSNEVVQQALASEISRRMKQGWELLGTGPNGAIMGRSKAKHNGILGGVLLAPFSVLLAGAWTLMRNFDTKNQGLVINVSEAGIVSSELVDYEQMMAQAAVQQANLED